METQIEKKLMGYRMTTAEITYHLPDHPILLQKYIWQDLDLAPKFPVLRDFLKFWEHTLDGALHSVRISSRALIRPQEFRLVGTSVRLH